MTASSTGTRRSPIFGPERWAELGGHAWCHFDRWFALVTVSEFGSDAVALRTALEAELATINGRRDVIAKLSHLADLRRRLDDADVTMVDLARFETADKATQTKARRKVLTQALDHRAMTDAMHHTPSALLQRRARSGHWWRFPSDPQRFHDRLASRRHHFVDMNGSFSAVDAHCRRLEQLDGPRRTLVDRLALYRAFHTVGIELAERAGDSFGVVGELRAQAYRTYLSLDWPATGIQRADYWQDLCELLVAEDYALTYGDEAAAFVRAEADDVPIIEAILLQLEAERRAAYEHHRADEAIALIGWCHAATGYHGGSVTGAQAGRLR